MKRAEIGDPRRRPHSNPVNAGLAVGGDGQRRLGLIVVDALDRLQLNARIVKQDLLRLLPDAATDERHRHFRSALPTLRLQMIEPRRRRFNDARCHQARQRRTNRETLCHARPHHCHARPHQMKANVRGVAIASATAQVRR